MGANVLSVIGVKLLTNQAWLLANYSQALAASPAAQAWFDRLPWLQATKASQGLIWQKIQEPLTLCKFGGGLTIKPGCKSSSRGLVWQAALAQATKSAKAWFDRLFNNHWLWVQICFRVVGGQCPPLLKGKICVACLSYIPLVPFTYMYWSGAKS